VSALAQELSFDDGRDREQSNVVPLRTDSVPDQRAWPLRLGGETIDIVRAGLIGTAPVAPVVAGVVALATYFSRNLAGMHSPSFEVGILAFVIAWVAVALVYAFLGYTSVLRANATTYCDLSNLFTELCGARKAIELTATDPDEKLHQSVLAAREKFDRYMNAVQTGVWDGAWPRASWVMGLGYVSAWQLLHRAQECLVFLEDTRQLTLRAQYDLQRLTGAQIDKKEQLVVKLKAVIDSLKPSLANYETAPSTMCESEAQLIVATVRQTLNDYRDDNRAALVRARINLSCTTVVIGMIGYAALWLALASQVDIVQLQAAVGFYVVGALVGLFGRLHAEIGNDTAVDDFGLSGVRHVAGPQLSGMAAVLGVGLVAVLGVMQQGDLGLLSKAFNLGQSPMNIVTAGLFGLTPGLLIERLRQQTDDVKKNLRSTQPQTGAETAA